MQIGCLFFEKRAMEMQVSQAAVSGTVVDASAFHPAPPGVHSSAAPYCKASQPQRHLSGVAPGTGAESARKREGSLEDSVPAPGTPILSTGSKRKADATSPPKSVNPSPWSRVKRTAGSPSIPSVAARTIKGKASSGFLEFGRPRSCEDIWEEDLNNQIVQVLMMHCQEAMHRNDKSQRVELYFYGLSIQSRWARFALAEETAQRFLQFKETRLKDKDSAYLQFSCVSHARSKMSADENRSMQFRVSPQSLFEEFEANDLWKSVAPTIVDNFAHLSGVAAGTRLFVWGRVHEIDEVIPGSSCNPRRSGALMDQFGNKRPMTMWAPVTTMFPWAVNMIITVLGARCERKAGFSLQFVLNGDVCIMHHEEEGLESYAQKVRTRNWDLGPDLPRAASSYEEYRGF